MTPPHGQFTQSRREFGYTIIATILGLPLTASRLWAGPPTPIFIDGGSISVTFTGQLALAVVGAGTGGGRNFRYQPTNDDSSPGNEQGRVARALLYPNGPTGASQDLSNTNFIHLHPAGGTGEGPIRISMNPFDIESVQRLEVVSQANGQIRHEDPTAQIRRVIATGAGAPIDVAANFRLRLELEAL